MLRVAVPNKGSLSETAVDMLRTAGYAVRRDSRELTISDPDNQVDFFYLRPRDIATYVGSGALDIGITGRDLLLDSGSKATEFSDLGFGGSTFRFAGPVGAYNYVSDLQGLRLATSYPRLISGYLAEHGVDMDIVTLDGAVESAIQLGVADVIADVVSTGTTLRRAGLEIFADPILTSSAVLITAPQIYDGKTLNPDADTFERRLRGVQVGRQYVLVDYDAPIEHLEACTSITPGIESPTISPLQDEGWVAVRSMMPRVGINDTLDALHIAGAKAILVSSIQIARV